MMPMFTKDIMGNEYYHGYNEEYERFKIFCNMVNDVVPNIKHRATLAENKIIHDFMRSRYPDICEQDVIDFVATELTALAERCASEVTEEDIREYSR